MPISITERLKQNQRSQHIKSELKIHYRHRKFREKLDEKFKEKQKAQKIFVIFSEP